MGLFGPAHGWWGGGELKGSLLPKICHIHATIMNLGTVICYLKKIQKIYDHVTYSISSVDISTFSPEISKFCYIKKYRYRLDFDTLFLIRFIFFYYLRIVLINVVTILMMPAKTSTLGFLNIKVFWRLWRHNLCLWRHQQIIITWLNLYWSCDQNLVTLAFLWEKLPKPQFFKDLTRMTTFFWEVVLVQVQ